MSSFTSIPPAIAAAVLAVLVAGGTICTSSVPAGAPVAFQAAEDPNIRCAAGQATSIAIPFERIIPSGVEHETPPDDYVRYRGPLLLAVISDSTRWPTVWRAAVDSLTTPPVTFGRDVLVLVATSTYSMGPTELRIASIRQCRRTGVIVVSTREVRPSVVAIPMRSRALDLVRVTGRLLTEHPVLFDQHLRLLP